MTQYGNLFIKSKPILEGPAALPSLVDWKKPFEAKRFGAGNIKVTRGPRVILRIRLPAVGGVILLAVKMKMHSWDGNTIGACYRIESSSAIIGPTVDDSGPLGELLIFERYMSLYVRVESALRPIKSYCPAM